MSDDQYSPRGQGRIGPVVASVFLPGVGHIALRRTGRALGIIAIGQGFAWIMAVLAALGLRWLCLAMLLLGVGFVVAVCLDARHLAKSPDCALASKWVVIGAAIAVLLLMELNSVARQQLVVEAFRIPSESMAPTLVSGDHVFVSKLDRQPSRGALVAYADREQGLRFLKRVVGLPGDTVAIASEGLFVNGKATWLGARSEFCRDDSGDCEFVSETLGGTTYTVSPTPHLGEWKVPDGTVFVLGDNRAKSLDSRHVGSIPLDDLIGKPTFIWWSEQGTTRLLTPL